jgi:nucleotide-binding universal stress UspA family protein
MSAAPRRVLVVTAGEGELMAEELRERVARTHAEVLVVAPAVNSRLRHWLSDVDRARRQAGDRALRCVEHLRLAGYDAEGIVGDPDPAQAIDDALAVFDADLVVVDGELAPRAGRRAWLHIVSLEHAA